MFTELYDKYARQSMELMLAKNHDYDEAWRLMRITSYTDMILQKIRRTKSIEVTTERRWCQKELMPIIWI
jgi:hypothetical protein